MSAIKISPPAAPATGREPITTLAAVASLFRDLNRANLRYCHWKSNLRLAQGLGGYTDLDLLVDPVHGRAFRQILRAHKVKPLVAAPGKRYPDMEHYLGFDAASGRLFHLHVHYQLVLGEQHVKNYCLPLAGRFLDSVHLHHGVKIPTPELELIVLSLRALLKYRDRDAVKDVLGIRSSGLPAHIVDEIHWLLAQTCLTDVARTLAETAGVLPAEVVMSFLETVIAAPRDGKRLLSLRQQVRRELARFQRHGRPVAMLQYFKALRTPPQKMTLPRHGLALSLVGVDGAGKSTLCRELAKWLSWKMSVKPYYLGSKQPSRLSRGLYILFRVARRGQRGLAGRFGEQSLPARGAATLRQAMLYSHHLAVGLDRYRRYRDGRQQAEKGAVVLYDRFPLDTLFDGPKIHLLAQGKRDRLNAVFSSLEQKLYRRFQAPPLLVVLYVPPEVSRQRKPDHRWEVITAKDLALRQWLAHANGSTRPHTYVQLDAGRPLADVLLQLKQVVWEAL